MSLPDLKSLMDRCTEIGECWVWACGVGGTGHPTCSHNGRSILVRRRAYEMHHGKPPSSDKRLALRMTCGTALCVRPEHIEQTTRSRMLRLAHAANPRQITARALRAGRSLPHVKLNMDAARAIRADPRSESVVAADYGVCQSTVGAIRRNLTWREVIPSSNVFSFRPQASRAGRASLDCKAA